MQSWGYDEFGRVDDIAAVSDSDPNNPFTHFAYGYDSDSNITSQQYLHKTSSPSNTYGYDTLDRLTSAEYFSDSSDTESFDYDDLGNRESVNLRDGTTENYAVNDENNQYNTIDGEALSYDAAGNVTCDADGYMYSWDHENHLTTIEKTNTSGELELVAEYVYDALGRRVGFTEYRSGVARYVREFSYDGWRQLTEIVRFGTLELYRDYAYGNGLDEVLLSRYRHSIGSLYYLHDHLNSPAALVADYDSGQAGPQVRLPNAMNMMPTASVMFTMRTIMKRLQAL